MLNTNLSYQSLNALTNMYASIGLFGHITLYCELCKGCVLYEAEYIIKCATINFFLKCSASSEGWVC